MNGDKSAGPLGSARTYDYLVVGAGAAGMAFVDELVRKSKTNRVLVVERRAQPGGHWNDAYDFVTLHQPAAFYGVGSRRLERHAEDLATKARILRYYRQVKNDLQRTGRVRFLMGHEFSEDAGVRSLSGEVIDGLGWRKLVDTSFMDVRVPSTSPPAYEVEDGVHLVPVNGLLGETQRWERYVVIGAGKTGMDVVLHLLSQGVLPERIRWVMPNDVWLVNRRVMKADGRYAMLLFSALGRASSNETALDKLEAAGVLLRLDTTRRPTRCRCATVSEGELADLRRVSSVIRLGRVRRIEPSRIILENGEVPTDQATLHVDCSSNGLPRREGRKTFEESRITPQSVFLCQPTLSAAFVAHVELMFEDDSVKNHLCEVVPHPVMPEDVVDGFGRTFRNNVRWGKHWGLVRWMLSHRLSNARHYHFLPKLQHIGIAIWVIPRLAERMEAWVK